MAQIGEGLWFDLDLDDKKFQSKVESIEKQVNSLSKNLDLGINKAHLKQEISAALAGTHSFKVNVEADNLKSKLGTAISNLADTDLKLGVNATHLRKTIERALAEPFTINLKVDKNLAPNSVNLTTESVKALNKEFKKQEDLASSLQKKFLALYSVDMARRFLTQIVEIGGEIERQKLALGSIVGDTALADELYGKLSKLSMISPFDVQDIMKYSKQLSAFGIQYNDLYETTKKLADIAAGVGVDFGRIAYEFGQTSARKLKSAA